MCNLYRHRGKDEQMALVARAMAGVPEREVPELVYPKYDAFVIRREAGERVLDCMSWGIIATVKGKSGKLLQKPVTNVRNLQSPFWRSTIAKPEQRCLVPFTAFAEPKPGKDEAGRPAQHWFTVPSAPISCFAGIWRWSEGKPRFAFLTCEPNPLVAPLHEKAMPVILAPEDYDRWLIGEAEEVCALAQPFPSQLMAVG
ncbi:MAG: SOS response-associated peptidase [Allosphingosinicella sp.]|uniref:SOS response-associated peptidase n=1 Tax=Allosphingosinicella sp. TaxID=2823234 RepID=UPI00394B64A1